jgi:Spy/CpxP family protein refolding chaperone
MIRRMLQAVVVVGVVFALLPVAHAQPPVAWWENPVAYGLTLSDAQWSRVNHILGEYRERLTLERQEAERAEREFESAINAETVDYQRGRIAIDQLVKARSVFTQDVSQMTLRLRAVLTADQWRSLQTRRRGLEAGRQGGGREGGKGFRPEGRGRKGGPPVGSQPGSGPPR